MNFKSDFVRNFNCKKQPNASYKCENVLEAINTYVGREKFHREVGSLMQIEALSLR